MVQNENKIRVFLAIELPEEIKRFLKQISGELKECGADVGWVKPAGMHLTLKFLGQIRVDLVREIERKVSPIFAAQGKSNHTISGVGAFPDLRRPRVVWVGCSDDNGSLPPLVAKLEESLAGLGFSKEKRSFRPHLTLGRVRSNSGIASLIDGIRAKADVSGPAFTADHAILFRSVLKPTGAEYAPLVRFDFLG